MEFLRNLWLGKYSLAKVFWVYNILVGGILGGIVSLFERILLRSDASNSLLVMLVVIGGGFINYGFVVLIGIWNSASQYKGDLIWAILAKAHVVLGLIFLVFSIVASAAIYPAVALFIVVLIIASIFILNSKGDAKDFTEHKEAIKTYEESKVQELPKSVPLNSNMKGLDLNPNDLVGTEDWNLAIKYDSALKQAFTDIYKISPALALRFKDSLCKTKVFDNYSEIKDRFLKEALGLNTQQKVYFKNEFLNEIAQVLLSQNSLAAAEFIKLVSMYNLEASTDSADGIAKIFDWLKKVENSYKISVRDKLVLAKDILPESNGFQIKHKLYEKFEDLGHVCYLLYNGNCAIVRSSEYRIYDSKKSAGFALAYYTNNDQWTVKNLVDRLDINGDPKDSIPSSNNVSKEKELPEKSGPTFKQILIDVLINSEFAIVATGNLINWGLFIFFASMIIITILYEYGIFPAFLVLILICGLTGGYYFFRQTKMEKMTQIIPCPKCTSKFRVPSGKHIEVSCKNCSYKWKLHT